MAEIGSWNGISFVVSPEMIRGFSDLTVHGYSETEEKQNGGIGYVQRKNSKPREVTMTVHLHAHFGLDVRTEAMRFVDAASNGAKDYMYIGGKKLMECMLMLTDAQISDIAFSPKGKWVSAQAELTFKQCGKGNGVSDPTGTGGGDGGNGGGGDDKVKGGVITIDPAPKKKIDIVRDKYGSGAAEEAVEDAIKTKTLAEEISDKFKRRDVIGRGTAGGKMVAMED